MDAAALWQRYQDWLYYHEQLGIYVDISRMSFDDAFVERLQPQFKKAFLAMDALEAGEIANPDENRMVGHYWLRDPELAPTPELKQEIVTTLEKIEAFAADVHAGRVKPPTAPRFTDIISIGIGGSALGPQFVSQALAALHPALETHFIDNTDPAGIDRILDLFQDRLATTLVITVSKSGGTPETRNGMREVQHRYKTLGLDFAQHAIAVTGDGSKLANLAESEGWLAIFPMQDWVGGRTSELSAVGLVPASLEGIAIREMLAGAQSMDVATRVHDLKQNPAALLALSWYFAGEGQGKKDMVILPYKDSLMLFSRYLQQLVMESLGKEKDLDGRIVHQGMAVYGNKGSTDQHAYVQELREGIPNFFLTFIEVLKDREGHRVEVEPGVTSGDYLSGFLLGTRSALFEKRRDSITVTLPEVTSKHVGALIALYERAVGLYAFLINVNAYHQPGVEAGKKAAAATLDLQHQVMRVLKSTLTPLPIASLAEKAGAVDQVETIYQIVRHLAANNRGVELYGNPEEPAGIQAIYKG